MALTKSDLKAIAEIVNDSIKSNNEVLQEIFVEEVDFEERVRKVIKEEIGHLPTRDEFYNSQAEIMKELKAIREEQTVQGHQVSENRDRVEKLEGKIAIQSV